MKSPDEELLANVTREYDSTSGEGETDPKRIVGLYHNMLIANRLPAGDYLELGVHKGFMLKCIHRFMNPTRELYGIDTFAGFDVRDIAAEVPNNSYWHEGHFSPTSVEAVAAYLGNPANLHLIQGRFPDCYAGEVAKRLWCFIHVDLDLFLPTCQALSLLWPKLLPGGVMLLHDYEELENVRRAVNDFCASNGLDTPMVLPDVHRTGVLYKG